MLTVDIDSRFVRSLVRSSAILILAACAPDPVAPTRAPDFAPAFAKAAGGPSVNSTFPTSGDKGQTLDVHVFGSGFGPGANAQWALHGVVDPTKVRTNRTTVVSSTELVANITISADATIAYWDVQVALGGKTGVGTELFEVTTAIPVLSVGGNSGAAAVNDQGDIVGGYAFTPTEGHGFVVRGSDGIVSDVGLGGPQGISGDGLIVVGGIPTTAGSPFAGVWTRPAGAAWPSAGVQLPDPLGMTSGGGRANGVATIAAEGVTVITGTLKQTIGVAVYWQSADRTWSSPAQRLPVPAGFPGATAETIAATTGDIGGELSEGTRGRSVPSVWRRASGSYVLDTLPFPNGYTSGGVHGISPNGTIIVGYVRLPSGKQVLAPCAWTRNATSGSYNVNLLPTLSGTYSSEGRAYGVTVVGTQVRAVGTSPSSANSFLHAALWTWTVGAADFQVRDIGGLGTNSNVVARTINPSGTIIVGGDGTSTAIKWRLQ